MSLSETRRRNRIAKIRAKLDEVAVMHDAEFALV